MESLDAAPLPSHTPLSNAKRLALFRARNMMKKKQPIGLWGRHGLLTPEEAAFAVQQIERELTGGNVVTTSWVQDLVSLFPFSFCSLLFTLLQFENFILFSCQICVKYGKFRKYFLNPPSNGQESGFENIHNFD
jgi:hypothetical protein